MICNSITAFMLLLVVQFSHFIKAINIDFFNQLIEINENRLLIDRNNLLISDLNDATIFKFKLQYDYNEFISDLVVIDNLAKSNENQKRNSILPYSYDSATNSIDVDITGMEIAELDIDIVIQYSSKLLKTENQVISSLADDIQSLYFPINKTPLTNYHIDKFERTLVKSLVDDSKALRFSDQETTFISLNDNGEYINKLPIADVEPNSEEQIDTVNVYFDFNKPLLTVTKAIRNVYLSHWSNTIQFDEHYIIENDVPKLAKTFKRKEYMGYQSMKHGGSGLALSQFEAVLPKGSFDHYYRDDLGMITTMRVLHHPRANFDTFALKPRYPVLGSWNYIFNIGWYNKLEQFSHFLSSSNGNQEFLLELPVLNGASDLIYQNMTINVILPEGVKIKSIYAPDLNSLPGTDKNPKVEFNKFENLFDYSDDKSTEIKITYSDVNINSNLLKIENSDNKIFVKYEINNFKVYYDKVLRLALWIFLTLISVYLLGAINDNLKK